MKIPWDKQYLKIAFHVVFTFAFVYALMLILRNFTDIFSALMQYLNKIKIAFSPLITAIIISYLCDPLVDFFQNKLSKFSKKKKERKSRTLGTACFYIVFLLLLFLLFSTLFKKIGDTNLNGLLFSVDSFVRNFTDMLTKVQIQLLKAGILEEFNGFIDAAITTLTQLAQGIGRSMGQIITGAGAIIANLAMGFLIAFYFLKDKENILYYLKQVMKTFLPPALNEKTLRFLSITNTIFSGYIRGQIIDACIVATLLSVGLSFCKINYPIVIGIISGFSNLIPYVGAFVAFILAVSMGLLSGEPSRALSAAIVVIVLQQIDGSFIVPKVVGKSVELHPVLVIIALTVSASLFGLIGMVVAVPVMAIIKLFAVEYYKSKSLADF